MTVVEYEALLQASYNYTKILKRRFEEEKAKSISNKDHIYLIYQYQWLSIKYRLFDTKELLIEDFIKKTLGPSAAFSYREFEMLIQSIMYLIFDDVYHLTQLSYDNGIDLECFDEYSFDGENVLGKVKKIIQCKYYKGYIPVNEIREFYGVMNSEISVGYFCSTGRFTRSGLEFASKIKKAPFANHIYLIDGTKLNQIMNLLDQIYEIIEDEKSNTNSIDSLREKAKMIICQPLVDPMRQGELFI